MAAWVNIAPPCARRPWLNVVNLAVKKAAPLGGAAYLWEKLTQRKAEGGELNRLERGAYRHDPALASAFRRGRIVLVLEVPTRKMSSEVIHINDYRHGETVARRSQFYLH